MGKYYEEEMSFIMGRTDVDENLLDYWEDKKIRFKIEYFHKDFQKIYVDVKTISDRLLDSLSHSIFET